MHKAYNETDYFADTHESRFGAGKLNRTTRHQSLIRDVTSNKLANTQSGGFYKTEYLKDETNHFTSPPYCIIKPGYRASEPFPNHDMLAVKHLYSFKPFGGQKH